VTASLSTMDEKSWVHCTSCRTLLYRKRLRRNLHVCPECGDHQRLDALARIAQLADPDTFRPLARAAAQVDPLDFVDAKPYRDRLAAARSATGLAEAVVCGEASIGGHRTVLAVMDFRFLGGSLGAAVGELICAAAEHALDRRLPLIIVTASGGARMQEGALSLMQMATTSQAIAELREAGLLTISLITDPTYGGVAASFATNTDVVVAESGARLGFAGPRVIRQTIRQALPDGFQTADFLLRHGQVDMVIERRNLRSRLHRLLAVGHAGRPAAHPAPAAAEPGPAGPVLVTDPDRFGAADAWQAVQSARNTDRPTTLDYLATAFDGFVQLHGDRLGADCPAIVAGFARLGGTQVAVVGHQKGHSTKDLLARNFGMPNPSGYRKAQRVMRLAAQLGLPVVTLIDTPGAYPGIEAEENGQAGAIAESILAMTGLRVPVVAVVTGEGGSGGALALAVADRVLMLENAVYSVISPEGCAAILWNDPTQSARAARALRITAPEQLRAGIADGIVPEPPAGAHRDPVGAAQLLRAALIESLQPLLGVPADRLVRERRQRFRRYGASAGPAVPDPAGAVADPAGAVADPAGAVADPAGVVADPARPTPNGAGR
jgi:acyl-CoA carboxylase subunit beta